MGKFVEPISSIYDLDDLLRFNQMKTTYTQMLSIDKTAA